MPEKIEHELPQAHVANVAFENIWFWQKSRYLEDGWMVSVIRPAGWRGLIVLPFAELRPWAHRPLGRDQDISAFKIEYCHNGFRETMGPWSPRRRATLSDVVELSKYDVSDEWAKG